MKQTTCAEDTLFSAPHPHLYKRVSVRNVLQSTFIAAGGALLLVISSVNEKSDTTFDMIFLTLGVILLLFAIYRFFWKTYEMVYRPTESPVRSGSLYMDCSELERVNQLLKKGDFSNLSRIACKDGSNGRMDFLVSKDGQFAAIQLFQFVPYTYEPISERCYYEGDVAIKIVRCITV